MEKKNLFFILVLTTVLSILLIQPAKAQFTFSCNLDTVVPNGYSTLSSNCRTLNYSHTQPRNYEPEDKFLRKESFIPYDTAKTPLKYIRLKAT